MRFKFETADAKALRCCFCCHVRTGTIFLGMFVLLLQLISLVLFVVSLIHPVILEMPNSLLRLPEPSNDSFLTYDRLQLSTTEDRFFMLLLLVGMVSVSSMLIYGAVKGRAGYLMPFFCIQVFNFSITCLSGVNYFSYVPSIKRWIEAQPDLPYKEELLAMDSDWLMLVFVLSFALVLMVQAYLIGVVWACYKYLIQYERSLVTGTLPIRTFPNAEQSEDTEMLLPPKYEDAILQSANEPPPPPYSAE